MATDETYNGYANRETWAFCLWIDNDQGLQQWAIEAAREALEDTGDGMSPYALGELLIYCFYDMLAEIAYNGYSQQTANMLLEIGSKWRIDRDEVGAWARELAEVNA